MEEAKVRPSNKVIGLTGEQGSWVASGMQNCKSAQTQSWLIRRTGRIWVEMTRNCSEEQKTMVAEGGHCEHIRESSRGFSRARCPLDFAQFETDPESVS